MNATLPNGFCHEKLIIIFHDLGVVSNKYWNVVISLEHEFECGNIIINKDLLHAFIVYIHKHCIIRTLDYNVWKKYHSMIDWTCFFSSPAN